MRALKPPGDGRRGRARSRVEAETRRELENTKRELMKGITDASALTSRAASLPGRMEIGASQDQALGGAGRRTQARREAHAKKRGKPLAQVRRNRARRTKDLAAERREQSASR